MSKSWLWVFVVWFISLLVGVLWGLLSLPGVNATRIGEGLGKYSATVQVVSPALPVLLVLALVLLTLAYAILTHKLRRATDSLASIAAYQSKLLAANQRAYLCIEPLGIVLTVGGTRVLGHVGIRTVGNLPAHSGRWFLDIKGSPNAAEKSFPIGARSGDLVAPPGVSVTRGTKVGMLIADLNEQGLSIVRLRSEENPVFIYVWGMVLYQDGLGK
ncbi:MAG: hypothetical protein WBQ20_04900, partial [Methyloceanibacter sp.]